MSQIDFGAIIRRSFELTKKHKWLLVYGLILGAASGGGGFNGLGNFNSDDPAKDLNFPAVSYDWLVDAVYAVPPTTWLLLGLGVIFLLILGIAVSWVAQSFAKGALIGGLMEAENKGEVTLRTSGRFGLATIKPLILYNLLVFGVTILIVGVALLLVILSSLVFTVLRLEFLIAVVVFIALLIFIIAMLVLAMMQIYADRLIVLKGYSPDQALRRALSLSRGHFLTTVLMSLINMTISCSLGCLSTVFLAVFLGIPAAIALIPSFQNGFQLPSVPVLIFLAVLLILAVIAGTVFRAAVVVFNFSNWNLLFTKLLADEEENK